jgi:hypothetical protein
MSNNAINSDVQKRRFALLFTVRVDGERYAAKGDQKNGQVSET